jgi:TIR domain/NACHT domain
MEERQGNTRNPLSVFISYAHEDESWRQQLETHLSLLRRQGLIADWHDRRILAGDEWGRDIDEHLETAAIILLLISPDFLASDYCYQVEMRRALERHECGDVRVIPIILRPCDWQSSPFVHLQCLPPNGKALTEWNNQDVAFLEVAQGVRRVIEYPSNLVNLVPPLLEKEQQNRMRLLKHVRTTWIDGLLKQSLHQAAWIDLHLKDQRDVLKNPWRLQVQELDQSPRLLPAGTSIAQVYDEADGELFILGEPGAGKTTLLLELARTLLERAEREKSIRIPVVFNLSSWATTYQSLDKWIEKELEAKYQIYRTWQEKFFDFFSRITHPFNTGHVRIISEQIIPLLDGLDEVAENMRPACVQAINTYYQHRLEKGAAPMVICSRSEEYMALPARINLSRVVTIQPLTDDQIEHYLQSAQGQLEGLQDALQNDAELYELAHRPLMLNILTLAYRATAPENFPTKGAREVLQRQVFSTYVERMLTRRGISRNFSPEQAVQWLTFLAKQMQRHHQSIFYLENMEPDWLGNKLSMYRLSVGLIGGLSIGLTVGLLTQLPHELLVIPGIESGIGPITGVIIGALSGLIAGIFFALTYGSGYDILGSFGNLFQYFFLRFWLWHANYFPRNPVSFLDEAVERLLLRKVGGGYIFIHRLLLDYFASLEKKEI